MFRGSRWAAYRFLVRLLILGLLLTGKGEMAPSLRDMAWHLCLVAAVVCAIAALILRESPTRREFTHWDEAVVFLGLCLAVRWTA